MARPSAATRNLTLTEELEKLEQQITLTLQEIDANFSRAHRIVTSSIIPVVQQYGAHSAAVWEGSRFWKEFFEASANISLTGYEEPTDGDDDDDDATVTTDGAHAGDEGDTTNATDESSEARERPTSSFEVGAADDIDIDVEASSLLDSPGLTAHSTPRPSTRNPDQRHQDNIDESSFAEYPSPYETLKQDMATSSGKHPTAPTTPGAKPSASTATPRRQDQHPKPSPFMPSTSHRPNADPLLHRVLDKNYRIQATPHTARKGRPQKPTASTSLGDNDDRNPQPTRTMLTSALDSSPFSPQLAAPQLRAEIFGSPARPARGARPAPAPTPRTPGVSVQKAGARSGFTPASLAGTRKTLFPSDPNVAAQQQQQQQQEAQKSWDSDGSDTEDFFGGPGGMSPPKTMQLNLPSMGARVLQTPAREASRRIVEDLLLTAGGGDDDEITDDYVEEGAAGGMADDSPSVVRVERPPAGDDEF